MGFLRTVNEASQNLEQGWLLEYLLLIWNVFSCPKKNTCPNPHEKQKSRNKTELDFFQPSKVNTTWRDSQESDLREGTLSSDVSGLEKPRKVVFIKPSGCEVEVYVRRGVLVSMMIQFFGLGEELGNKNNRHRSHLAREELKCEIRSYMISSGLMLGNCWIKTPSSEPFWKMISYSRSRSPEFLHVFFEECRVLEPRSSL